MDFLRNIAALFKVKTIVTFAVTAVFASSRFAATSRQIMSW